MWDFRTIVGIVAVVIALVSYVPYIRDILKGSTKPHPISWFAFAVLMGITFTAQIVTGAGPGAWVTGVSALAVFAIAIFAIIHGGVEIVLFDWVCLFAALLGIVLWRITSDPFHAVLIVSITHMIAMGPLIRKAYYKPFEETMSLFVLSIAKFVVGFMAFTSFTITNSLYPSLIIVINIGLVTMLVRRRREVSITQ